MDIEPFTCAAARPSPEDRGIMLRDDLHASMRAGRRRKETECSVQHPSCSSDGAMLMKLIGCGTRPFALFVGLQLIDPAT